MEKNRIENIIFIDFIPIKDREKKRIDAETNKWIDDEKIKRKIKVLKDIN